MSSIDRARIAAKTPNPSSVNKMKAQILATRGNNSQGHPARLDVNRLPGQVRALIASGGRRRIVVNDRRRTPSEIHE